MQILSSTDVSSIGRGVRSLMHRFPGRGEGGGGGGLLPLPHPINIFMITASLILDVG